MIPSYNFWYLPLPQALHFPLMAAEPTFVPEPEHFGLLQRDSPQASHL